MSGSGGYGTSGGNEPARAPIVTVDALAKLVGDLRAKGKRVLHARGTFDLLQRSGIARLEVARATADALVATISPLGDATFRAPVLDAKLRAEVVASLPFVAAVAIEEGANPASSVQAIVADVLLADADGPPSVAAIPQDLPSALHVLDAGARKDVVYEKREAFTPEAEAFLRRFRSHYTATDVIRALQALKPLRALVVGDAIIDEYHFVRPYGMPLKAPIIAAQLLDVEAYAGGILAVANHIAGFCGEVHMVTGLGGTDTREELIRKSLRGNVDPKFFIRPGAPTTAKRRYLRRFLLQKLFEVGIFDDGPLPEDVDVEMASYLASVLPKYDLVVVADFGHGLLSRRSIEAISASPTFLALNTQLNSINYGYHVLTKWPRADYACIDEEETRMACRDRLGKVQDLLRNLATSLGCRTMTVTRGHHGSMTYSRGAEPVVVPILSRQVIDTLGAGDAYLSITAPCVRMGYPTDLPSGFIGATPWSGRSRSRDRRQPGAGRARGALRVHQRPHVRWKRERPGAEVRSGAMPQSRPPATESRVFAERYFADLKRIIDAMSCDDVGRVLDVLAAAHGTGKQVFLVGNGGSASTASHMANDLVWGMTRKGLPPFRAIALTDNVALMTAIGNDEGYASIFARQLEALAVPGDVLVAISGSGNSENVLRALETARRMKLVTVGILGMDGGKARGLVDAALVVPSNDYGPIEDLHMVIDHLALAYQRLAVPRAER